MTNGEFTIFCRFIRHDNGRSIIAGYKWAPGRFRSLQIAWIPKSQYVGRLFPAYHYVAPHWFEGGVGNLRWQRGTGP